MRYSWGAIAQSQNYKSVNKFFFLQQIRNEKKLIKSSEENFRTISFIYHFFDSWNRITLRMAT